MIKVGDKLHVKDEVREHFDFPYWEFDIVTVKSIFYNEGFEEYFIEEDGGLESYMDEDFDFTKGDSDERC